MPVLGFTTKLDHLIQAANLCLFKVQQIFLKRDVVSFNIRIIVVIILNALIYSSHQPQLYEQAR